MIFHKIICKRTFSREKRVPVIRKFFNFQPAKISTYTVPRFMYYINTKTEAVH